ncbi:MAG: hypothetical protein M1830_006491 [Pleopsidium flavum]|nr:MAG: hypothetical protein M1830_006491 [Pleopsidium flavum]
MTTTKDTSANAISFSSSHNPTPPNAPPPTHLSLTFSEAVDLWSHSTLLFHNQEWEQSLTAYRRILRQCGATIRRACLWFNIGVIRGLLGEYFLAAEAFAKALKLEPDFGVGWYCLGISLFQLSDFRKAKKAFDKCLNSFAAEEDTTEYQAQGLDFVLERTRVVWNCRQAVFEKNHKQIRAPLPLDTHMALNRMPAGKLFEPPIPEEEQLHDTQAFAIPSHDRATAPQLIASGSDKPRKGFRTLLRRRTKAPVRFEHSNPRLLALEETWSSSEFHREDIVSILAPSAITQSRNAQARPHKIESIAPGQNLEGKKQLFGSSTWPTVSKPLSRLPFVTAKDLAAVQNSNGRSRKSTMMTRARSSPHPPASQYLPSVPPSNQESSPTTAHIPTTSSLDTFMRTAPVIYTPNPPSPRGSTQQTLPATVFTPQAIPLDAAQRSTTLPSPSSLYSTVFDTQTLPTSFNNPLTTSASNPNPNPTTTTTTEIINTPRSQQATTYPPRWDSLPQHLKPARIHHPPNYQQRPAPSIYSPNPNRTRTHPLSNPNPHPNSNPDLESQRTLNSKAKVNKRFSTATIDSFAIVGMGRTSTSPDLNTSTNASSAGEWSEVEGVGLGMRNAEEMVSRSNGKKGKDTTAKNTGRRRAKWAGLGFHL